LPQTRPGRVVGATGAIIRYGADTVGTIPGFWEKAVIARTSRSTARYPDELRTAEAVKRQTFATHQEVLDDLSAVSDIWVAFSVYWYESGEEELHVLPLMEAAIESKASIISAAHGLYKSADTALRNLLELSVSSALFSQDATAIPEYEEKDRTPGWTRKLKPVFGSSRFRAYRRYLKKYRSNRLARSTWPSSVNRLYQSLSKSAHAHIDAWQWHTATSLAPNYDRRAFFEWRRDFRDVHRLSFLVVLLFLDAVSNWIRKEQRFLPWELVLRPRELQYLDLLEGRETRSGEPAND
jgi:hypothetical protein